MLLLCGCCVKKNEENKNNDKVLFNKNNKKILITFLFNFFLFAKIIGLLFSLKFVLYVELKCFSSCLYKVVCVCVCESMVV